MTLPVWLLAGAFGNDAGSSDTPATSRGRTAAAPETHPTDTAEHETLVRLRAGDAGALEAVYRELYPDLLRFAYLAVRSRPLAEEVVQDVFAALWERRATLAVRTTLRGYLFKAVRYRALNARRAEQTARRFERDVTEVAEDAAAMVGPDVALMTVEQAHAVGAAVARLSDKQRQAVLLRMQRRMAYQEIGDVLGVSADGARMLVNRALGELRRLLAEFLAE